MIISESFSAKPFRYPSHTTTKDTSDRNGLRSASPDSSGISADVTDSISGEDVKRVSDLSSLSSVDPNSSVSDSNEEGKLQAPAVIRHPQQPYLTRLTKTNPASSSVLQAVFDNIERPEIIRPFAENNDRKQWTIPTTVEEDMRKNDSPEWNIIPTTVTPPLPPKVDGGLTEEVILSRKRNICTKMSDSLRILEHSCNQIHKISAPQHWRAPHLLQTTLNSLRDSVTSAHDALEMFVDSTARISIDRRNPKAEEFDRLLKPLLAGRSQISSLRRNLDGDGWTVSALSRDYENTVRTMDSLDRFIIAIQKVPADCRRLLQWTQLLIPSSTIVFLNPFTNNRIETTSQANTLLPKIADRRTALLGSSLLLDDAKRLSSSSTSTVMSSDSSQPSSILVTKHNVDKPKGRVTFADEQYDRPSVSSSYDSNCTRSKNATNSSGSSSQDEYVSLPERRLQETRIIEEEDLESIVSDRESLYQDYAYLDDAEPGQSNTNVDKLINTGISDEDRQLARFYAPQFDQHIDSLSLAVEDFLGTVENNLPPKDFVQKGKLIILAAHKLIYIGDTVSQCVSDRTISHSLRQCADRLCELLKACVKAMKLASDEYPELKSMQGMIDSIISVSKTAHEMKALVKQWC
ncbi:hypothetical protein DICVIV_00232 [Dictyocaulus viviparus]|uniref:CAS family C-terminal domain-containing protein n=1 Tax=Dictyocaulus viviparus TaxID=29172 RepID=A0A0D8YBR6_DICVI|nr:hypothetical protein DICVIV_00232 [Dictyocaulus viviparus]